MSMEKRGSNSSWADDPEMDNEEEDTAPNAEKRKVTPPVARTFNPLNSPLEYLVPYTKKTKTIQPVVSEHLRSSFKKRSLLSAVFGFDPSFIRSKSDTRLITSEPVEIVNYIANQPGVTVGPENRRMYLRAQEENRRSMIVLDIFIPEKRSLRAWAIGLSPEDPLFIFCPAKHPYDTLLLETVGNRTTIDGVFQPPTLPFEPEDKEKSKQNFFEKVFSSFLFRKRKSPETPSSTKGPTMLNKPLLNKHLCQSFLQFRDPLEGPWSSQLVAALRWSTTWLNELLVKCLDPREKRVEPPILPTREEIAAMEARKAAIKEYEETVKSTKKIKITGGLTAEEREKLSQPNVLKTLEDAGRMYPEPEIVGAHDPSVCCFFPSRLTRDALALQRNSSQASSSVECRNSAPRALTSTAVDPQNTSLRRRSPTIINLGELFNQVKPELPRVNQPKPFELKECDSEFDASIPAEFAIVQEYQGRDFRNPDLVPVGGFPGIEIFYEPPLARLKQEEKSSELEYISGKYLWLLDRTSYVAVFERRKTTKEDTEEALIKREEAKKKEAQKEAERKRKEWEKAEDKRMAMNPTSQRRSKPVMEKNLETERTSFPHIGVVKLYHPTSSASDLLARLDLEKGQFLFRRDLPLEGLHMAVLAMFSVVNIEHALFQEIKARKKILKEEEKTLKKAEAGTQASWANFTWPSVFDEDNMNIARLRPVLFVVDQVLKFFMQPQAGLYVKTREEAVARST
ncbi:hypothetical protein BDZ91DRAFT_799575 [Kalaharituber pfeilii]|nr:hypothetical protein BDZ91DRAFT_799575 [Kalaharituber pfeilii]